MPTMKTYRVTVYREETCWDSAEVEVQARTPAAARRAAIRLAKTDDDVDWDPATSETFASTGKYDANTPEED